MIRQLRRKMVATAMVSLFVVLTVILCAIHWVNYQAIVSSSDGVLDILGANRGMFPRPGVEGFSPEMPYEARYFSVLLNPPGTGRCGGGGSTVLPRACPVQGAEPERGHHPHAYHPGG